VLRVYVDRGDRTAAKRSHEIRPEQKIGHVMPVEDVDVKTVDVTVEKVDGRAERE